LRSGLCILFAIAVLAAVPRAGAQTGSAIDRDLMETDIPHLEELYAAHRYTVTEVTRWYLARIHRYNPIYRDIETIDEGGALATAARLDAEAAGTPHGSMWGVPIVLKANTSIAGLVTTDGWKGFTLPGHELIAPKDATIVARLKAAGVVILGHTNMPDFAASDTNRSSSFGRTGNAYDVRFSPGGSSGGTVTAVTSNQAEMGNGTDTGNSIRMPASTSSVVGYFPTRGLVSIAGIAPLDWLLDNTGPIARNVTDVAIALSVMAGAESGKATPDAADPRTAEAAAKAQAGPYTKYLKKDALKGKRFGVPKFILDGAGTPFHGTCETTPQSLAQEIADARIPLEPETRAAFLKAIEGLRAAGAEVVFSDEILPDSFPEIASRICTIPYIKEGAENFLAQYGPAQYRSAEEYAKVMGRPIPGAMIDGTYDEAPNRAKVVQTTLESDPNAKAFYFEPREKTLAIYDETLDRLKLDGFVYPAASMPPPDETMPQYGRISGGPHSDTAWVNMIGVPAIVVPGGFYPSGLPFGLEISTRRWHDGDLIGYGYAYEQATHLRQPPILVEKGLLPYAP
jgi:Asp-tRNA(Asn)/Glu-tRNA(Gln) amidotransferase A subunit family amidase